MAFATAANGRIFDAPALQMIGTMLLRRLIPTVGALALILTCAPALAQTPMDDPLDARDARRVERMEKVVRELRSIVFQGRDSGKPVVVQPAETEYQIQELTRRVSDLELTLTRLNGALETATFELDKSRREAESLRGQLQAQADRLTAIEQRAAAPPEDVAAAPAPAAGPTAGEAFAQARQLMLDGDYDGAQGAFQAYVDRYPDTPKTPEARYWLGKTLTARGANAEAAASYIGAIRGYPATSWAPDAMVELSRSLVALKKPADACLTLAALPKRYPKAPASVTGRAAAVRAQAKCAA